AWELALWSVMLVCLGLAVFSIWGIARRPAPEPAQVARFEVRAADGTSFDRRAPSLAISADGRLLAWSARGAPADTCPIFVRHAGRRTVGRPGSGRDRGRADHAADRTRRSASRLSRLAGWRSGPCLHDRLLAARRSARRARRVAGGIHEPADSAHGHHTRRGG